MKYIWICLVFILIIGCSGNNDTWFDPYQGTSALRVTFLRDMPPMKIYENDEFPIGLKLENQGAYNILDGMISVISEGDYLGVQNPVKKFSIEGKSLPLPHGESKTLFFNAKTTSLYDHSELDSRIVVLACYDYHTHFVSDICIDPRYYDTEQEKPCKVTPVTGSGSGAPVVVTQVEPRMKIDVNKNGVEVVIPEFMVHIRHMGTGEVIESSRIETICGTGKIDYDDFGIIYVSGKIGNNPLDCQPTAVRLPIKGQGDETLVKCAYPDLDISSEIIPHKSIITIDLDYAYMNTLATSVKIVNPI